MVADSGVVGVHGACERVWPDVVGTLEDKPRQLGLFQVIARDVLDWWRSFELRGRLARDELAMALLISAAVIRFIIVYEIHLSQMPTEAFRKP